MISSYEGGKSLYLRTERRAAAAAQLPTAPKARGGERRPTERHSSDGVNAGMKSENGDTHPVSSLAAAARTLPNR